MKRILLLLFLLNLIASGAASQSPKQGIGPGPTWQRFTIKDEEFSVILPNSPTMTTGGPAVKEFFSSIKLGKNTGGIQVSEAPSYAGDRIYTGKEVDVKARLLTKPEPPYTENARNNQIAGTVVLKAVFAKTGRVENIRVVSGLPHGLTEQAIKAAKQIRFTPAMKDGKPVSMWIQLEYNFSL